MITDTDRGHLRRCVELAEAALGSGNEPFGSVLVSADGAVLLEDHNRVGGGDATRHPEFAIARWAAGHLSPDQRSTSVVYTSGEHCAMCSAAHAWVGLGRIVYASSSAQLGRWFRGLGVPPGPVAALSIRQVAPGVPVDGPDEELAEQVRRLHHRYHRYHRFEEGAGSADPAGGVSPSGR
ncbi:MULTISPECIES: nucleoside deaminase [Micrococcaceae]|uniref:nucleoside deaminase n=1 Tax=Micrococcaceae TaxID=1268 RepID=UPI001612A5B3|nr:MULTISPECIES: nucleoside deaminase [Micrococcaceae]MBB5748830.1 tRNA(Arg) A34 adenosine deaminase TadA [Micrococcus sp. TA1]HRO29101.1 nucleoside deaminase [Citricoccus sp.]HRO92767.1 nucleoside deaminase [Citricoccus sp.]